MPASITSMCRQPRRGVQDPERGVVEVGASHEPLVRLVDGRKRPDGGAQELNLLVARAKIAQAFAEPGNRLVVGIQEPTLGEQRMDERVLHGSFDGPPKLGTRYEEGVDVDALGVERDRSRRHLAVVDRHQHEVDVGFRPDGVVGQAAAEERGENAPVLPDLLDEGVEGRRKLSGWVVSHALEGMH